MSIMLGMMLFALSSIFLLGAWTDRKKGYRVWWVVPLFIAIVLFLTGVIVVWP